MTALAATPSSAGTGSENLAEAGGWVSRASANSVNVAAGGQLAGNEGYVAVNDGTLETVTGVNAPELPMIGDQQIAVVGALGQDAVATPRGEAAACAGIVGRDGALKVGADNTCLISDDGTVRVSLGTLDQLGLTALLGGKVPGLPTLPEVPQTGDLPVPDAGDLPAPDTGNLPVPDLGGLPLPDAGDLPLPDTGDLPVPDTGNLPVPDAGSLPIPALPELNLSELDLSQLQALELPTGGLSDIELQVVGKSLTSECLVTPTEVYGKSNPVQASVVAVVAGQQIPLADLPPEGVSLNLADVLTKVRGQLPAEVGGALNQVLAAVPAEALDAVHVVDVAVGEQSEKLGQVTVTALGVQTAYPGLVDMSLGKVTCISNGGGAAVQAPETEAAVPAQPEADAQAKVDTSAGKVEVSKDNKVVSADVEQASSNSPIPPIGWGAVAALLLAGLGLAGYKLRRGFSRG